MVKKPSKTGPKQKTPKPVGDGVEPGNAQHTADLIRKALRNVEDRLDSNEIKATVGDFIRLLQMEKELEDARPTEIKVTWVDRETESGTGE